MADILPPAPIDAPFGGYAWADWYKKVRDNINAATSVVWSAITGTPTTLAGYGITDAQAKLTNSASLAASISDETGTGKLVFNDTPSLIAPYIGAGTGFTLALMADITTGSTRLHKTSVNLANGAGAAAGTIGNAPTAGNPTKWISIDDNGTIRYIPTWT